MRLPVGSEDWIKARSWDLPVSTLDEFLMFAGGPERDPRRVARWLFLDAALPMPDALVGDVLAWLDERAALRHAPLVFRRRFVGSRTASWDESLHPRGEGGRFGEKEDSEEAKPAATRMTRLEDVAMGARVQAVLTDDLRLPKYQGDPNLMAGHCYVATEALYHMIGGKTSDYTPQFVRHEDEPHWYLKGSDGSIIDLTASQFSTPVPYDEGIGKGFLTREPSARAQEVIDRVEAQTPEDRLGIALPHAEVDLSRADPALAPMIASRVEVFAAEFPVVAQDMRGFEVGRPNGRNVGEWDPVLHIVTLTDSPRYYGVPVSKADVLSHERWASTPADRLNANPYLETGKGQASFHPTDGPQATVDHELGHAVWTRAQNLERLSGQSYSRQVLGLKSEWDGGPKTPVRAITSAVREMGSEYGAKAFTASDRYTNTYGGQTSLGPRHDLDEAFADWFAARQVGLEGGTPPMLAEAFGRVVEGAKAPAGGAQAAVDDAPREGKTCEGFIPSWEWEVLTPEEQAALIPQAEEGLVASWDESLHPRGEGGKFTSKDSEDEEPKEARSPGDVPIAGWTGAAPRHQTRADQFDSWLRGERMTAAKQAAVERGVFTHPRMDRSLGVLADPATTAKMIVASEVEQRMAGVTTQDLLNAAVGRDRVGDEPIGMRFGTRGWEPLYASHYTGTERPEMVGPGKTYATPEEAAAAFHATEVQGLLGDPHVVGADHPEFDRLVREYAVGNLVQEWAGTSNDADRTSLAIQDAAVREFGLTGTHGWEMSEATANEVERETLANGPVYEAFVRAQYEATQEMLREAGIESIPLFRGTAVADVSPFAQSGEQSIELRPLSSFSTDSDLANGWGYGVEAGTRSAMVSGEIPAERILSTPLTGVGCWGEGEVVVIGGGDTRLDTQFRGSDSEGALIDFATNALGPDNWMATGATINNQDGDTIYATVTMKDSYTGYTRDVEVIVDNISSAQPTIVQSGENPPTLWAKEDRIASDMEAFKQVDMPAGWVVQPEGAYAQYEPTRFKVLGEANVATVPSVPYFMVDSGAGITPAGAERFVTTQVATTAAQVAQDEVAHMAGNRSWANADVTTLQNSRLEGTGTSTAAWSATNYTEPSAGGAGPAFTDGRIMWGVDAYADATGDNVAVTVTYTEHTVGSREPREPVEVTVEAEVPKAQFYEDPAGAVGSIREQVRDAFGGTVTEPPADPNAMPVPS